MPGEARVVPIRGAGGRTTRSLEGLPGVVCRRSEVAAPEAYAVFDCETTGTDTDSDEIVSLAIVVLDTDGVERERLTRLVRPRGPIPAAATAVHGIDDEAVADAPPFSEIAGDVLTVLDGAVFAAHNAPFDLAMLQRAFAQTRIDYRPSGVACTLDAFRLLEPLAENHRLESLCEARGIELGSAHEALGDVLATAALLGALLAEGLAPETVQLDHGAYMRLRSRGDTRPASEPQVRRVFGLARSAGLLGPDGAIDREQVIALVERVTGTTDVDGLTREQVQDVYDALDGLIEERRQHLHAASA
jgi:DNA polymerase III epsilon subunit family exonuclease